MDSPLLCLRAKRGLPPAETLKKAGICLGYFCVYMPWFLFLESHFRSYTLIRCGLDHLIPFCEYFVIPYLLWFPFVGLAFAWLITREEDALFTRFCVMMFGGMTIALLIYTVFPNGIFLRPALDGNKNLCTWLLATFVYRNDTPTNVFPSLHVYTCTVIALTIGRTELGERSPAVRRAVILMSVLIILSTMLIKQHSVLDVCAGFLMALAMYHTVFDHAAVRGTMNEKAVSSEPV